MVVADHLSREEALAYMLASVRLVERGSWDEQKLGQVLADLSLAELDFDIELTGFEGPEIDLAIEGLNQPPEAPDPADASPPEGPPVTRTGDLWRLGPHLLLCGDARDKASYKTLMNGEEARIVVTDPPFNVVIADNVSGKGAVKHGNFAMASGEMSEAEFTAFLMAVLTLMAEHSMNGALHVIAMDWRHMRETLAAGHHAYDDLINLCVWTKTQGGQGSFYRSQHELFFVFKKGRAPNVNNIKLGVYGRNRTNVWSYAGGNTFGRAGAGEGDLLKLHPTVKPVALLADILLDASHRGDVVLDPFAGSGSILIAAEKVGRRARAMEIDPLYVDVAVRRWQRWSGEDAVLEGDGRTFGQIQADRTEGGVP